MATGVTVEQWREMSSDVRDPGDGKIGFVAWPRARLRGVLHALWKSASSAHATDLMRVRVDIRPFKLVTAALAGLATIVGIWEPIQAEPLTVGAPPSLRAAFNEILPIFEGEYGAAVKIVYTPSKTLLHQIEKGAPIDVFVSAGLRKWNTCTRSD